MSPQSPVSTSMPIQEPEAGTDQALVEETDQILEQLAAITPPPGYEFRKLDDAQVGDLLDRPAASVEHKIGEPFARRLVAHVQRLQQYTEHGADSVVRDLADACDVDSLRVLMSIIKERPAALRSDVATGLTGSVLHMLTAGNTHEAFAREWMQAVSHSEALTEDLASWIYHFCSGELRIVDGQKLLGLARLAGNPFAPLHFYDRPTQGLAFLAEPLFARLGSLGARDDFRRAALEAMIVQMLRRYSPERLPLLPVINNMNGVDAISLIPMGDYLWTRRNHGALLVPLIERAYGDNFRVFAQVSGGFERALKNGELVPQTGFPQIRAVLLRRWWCRRDIASMLPNSLYAVGDRSVSWLEALLTLGKQGDKPMLVLVRTLRESGFDVNQMFAARKDGRAFSYTLLECCASQGWLETLEDLVRNGSDAQQQGWREDENGDRVPTPSVRQLAANWYESVECTEWDHTWYYVDKLLAHIHGENAETLSPAPARTADVDTAKSDGPFVTFYPAPPRTNDDVARA